MEDWRPIPGYEGSYEVSNLGNFKTMGNRPGNRISRLLKTKQMRDGYLYIRLNRSKKQEHFSAHRIVAKVFIENIDSKPEVNHIDGARDNNKASNLEWVTSQENMDNALARRGQWRRGSPFKTTRFAICHPLLPAVGAENRCKSCYMRQWHKSRKIRGRFFLGKKDGDSDLA